MNPSATPTIIHDAIVAALELHGTHTARHTIFSAALDEAAAHSSRARDAVGDAIQRYLATAA